MSQLTDNLYTIDAIKSGIRSAIEEKGVDMTGMSFPDYPAAISQIQTGGTFITETLSVSSNGTYTPGVGIDGYSQVIVDVPQSVTGFTEKEITEKSYAIVNLNNSANYVGRYAFYDYNRLNTVNLPNCSIISEHAFDNCLYLETVNLPNCIKIGDYDGGWGYAFQMCSRLTTVSLPVCEQLGSWTFAYCTGLPSINLPCCLKISQRVFSGCTSLSEVYLSVCTVIDNSVFTDCTALTSVWVYTSSVCLLNGNRVFSRADNALVYVPSSLVEAYKLAANWSSMSSRIFAIPE